ncbi:MAG: hypothetical protein Q4D73_05110, partial [Actinomycetaceae bacterium]|nr:hypothetical protein [Actinomycetaceae bacterium]
PASEPGPSYQADPVYQPEPAYQPEPTYQVEPSYQPEPSYSAQEYGTGAAEPTVTASISRAATAPAVEPEWDDETQGASLSDDDAGQGVEVGIPVVQKIFGAVVINELREGE